MTWPWWEVASWAWPRPESSFCGTRRSASSCWRKRKSSVGWALKVVVVVKELVLNGQMFCMSPLHSAVSECSKSDTLCLCWLCTPERWFWNRTRVKCKVWALIWGHWLVSISSYNSARGRISVSPQNVKLYLLICELVYLFQEIIWPNKDNIMFMLTVAAVDFDCR